MITINGKQYNNNILATARTRDSGMIIYKVGYTYYRSMYHVIKRGTDIFVYSFYMNYSDYIGHHVNINGDTRMEGSLSIINEYNNKSHVIINPLNKYVGVNTEQMVINYADKYATTTSRYNASHNLVVYNDKYPNAVFARIAEPTETAVINNADYKSGQILVAGKNFGCGSSREHAPWALLDFGIRCIVAESFADIFYNNCFKNGILPIVLPENQVKELSEAAKKNKEIEIDLVDQKIHKGDNRPFDFEIESFRKECLLNGYDDIALTLKKDAKINIFEQNKKNLTPWLY